MKLKLRNLLVIMLIITAVAFIGSFVTTDKTRYHNSFVRVFPPHAADEYKAIDLRSRVSLAGFSGNGFYLRSGSYLAEISNDMLDTCQIAIDNPNGYELLIDSPNFIIQSGTSAFLQRGNTRAWCVDTTFANIPGFTAVQQISKNSTVLRIIDMRLRKNLLAKIGVLQLKKDILKKQVDGILCTDGFLLYSKNQSTLVYVYRYRNEVICMDTALNIVRSFKTIDTTSVARIEVAEAGGKITMSKPPFIVNKNACVAGKNLFVHSNLVAFNEVADEVQNRSVVDVYNIKDGSYRFSFYIPDHSKSKMETFKVRGTILIAKFPRHIVRYDLVPEYLED